MDPSKSLVGMGAGLGGLKRKRRALGALPSFLAVLSLVGVGGLLVVLRPAEARPQRPAAQASELPVISVPPTTAPISSAPTPIPKHPIPVPADWYAQEPIVRIGTIAIPKIGVTAPMYDGVTLWNIDLGPSHWPGTAFPGQPGNAVIAGHRVTHTHPFLHIDKLVPGDQVIFDVFGWRSVYVVTGHEVVAPTDLAIANPTPNATATLFSCHPPRSAEYRYVVHLVLQGAPTRSAS